MKTFYPHIKNNEYVRQPITMLIFLFKMAIASVENEYYLLQCGSNRKQASSE